MRRTNRVVWGLVAVLTVALACGAVGLNHYYEFSLMDLWHNEGPGTLCCGEIHYHQYPFVTHYVELVFVSVLWTRRYRAE